MIVNVVVTAKELKDLGMESYELLETIEVTLADEQPDFPDFTVSITVEDL